jgi:HD-like signal output (HDOD) protein
MSNSHSQPVVSSAKTMELLWLRVRQRGDLPGFSKVISAILGAMRGEDDREFNMTKTVLSDPALTQRVLRLANSAMYSVFGRSINTVSKAVIVLGTESIGHLALGLKLIDGLSHASISSAVARTEMSKAVLAGHIARQVVSSAGTRDAEEAVVCSMLHSLGRMMVTFYLSEQWAVIQQRCVASNMGEEQIAPIVLGLDFAEIGRMVARQWGLPSALIDSLQDVHPKEMSEPLDHAGWLAALSTMSSRCADVLCEDETSAAGAVLQLAEGYSTMLGLEAAQVLGAVESAMSMAEQDAVFVHTPALVDSIRKLTVFSPGKPSNAAQILTRGVSDMRDAVNSASSGQLMTMALETVYKGLGLSRAIAFFRRSEEEKYRAQMCFGDGVQELMPRLSFSDAYQPDVFHAALANDKMIFIENAQDAAFTNKLPRWWRDALFDCRSFLVLPLMVNHQPIGFIYGDWNKFLPACKIVQAEVMPLNDLRVLVVRAVEQRRQLGLL